MPDEYIQPPVFYKDIQEKIDALQAMLDSTVYGLQKISSNLDDIMVKLDV